MEPGTTRRDPLAEELRAIVGAGHVLDEPALRAGYEIDSTRRFGAPARLVVRPGSTAEVAAIVRRCAATGVPIVPQGGNTGLVGGGVPRGGEVLLSLRRLDDVGEVDVEAAEVAAGSGVTLARLQATAAAAHFSFGVDLAARDSATVGGMIATNAGGVHALRYGSMRRQVVGVEAVLASGRVVARMPGLRSDGAGYDLPSLLAGSEGTLAIITAARLRLVPEWRHRVTALVALPAPAAESAVSLVARLRARLPSLEGAELFFHDGLALVLESRGAAPPFRDRADGYLLVDCAADDDPAPALEELLAASPELADAVLAADATSRRRLWDLREGISDAIAALGIPHKLDVGVPLRAVPELVDRLPALVRDLGGAEGWRVIVFGHVALGNLHVNVIGPDPGDDRIDDAVLRLVAGLGGSIAAEHGVGVAKRRWLSLSRSGADIAAMRAIKAALDPGGLLNPGVLFDPEEP